MTDEIITKDGERPFNRTMEDAIHNCLRSSHPDDSTGYYTLLRAFQFHIRGELVERDRFMKMANNEHNNCRKTGIIKR